LVMWLLAIFWCWVCWLLFEHSLALLYVRTVVFVVVDFNWKFGF